MPKEGVYSVYFQIVFYIVAQRQFRMLDLTDSILISEHTA